MTVRLAGLVDRFHPCLDPWAEPGPGQAVGMAQPVSEHHMAGWFL